MTEDLLKLSRIEAGQLQLECQTLSVHQVAEPRVDTARLKAEHPELALEVRIPEGLPLLRGDANRLREVLQNLLDNAVQYTPAGGRIELSGSHTDNQVVLTVSDTGIGIPETEQQRIS